MEIKKAVRKAIPFIGCFYGKSGGGKTYSAIKLASGLVDGGKVCLIDTENGRASHYADDFDNLYILDLEPPFTPARYIEAIKAAERAGYKAIIIDSISHEWDGIGGCLEMAEGKQGLLAWAKPKAEHRKLMNMLLQSKAHVIFCARAKEEMEQVKINGKAEIVNKGIIPIQEKNFPFEMLVTFRMAEKGKVIIEKCIKSLESSLQIKEGEFVSEKHGKMIADWIDKGEPIDLDVKRLKGDAVNIATSEGEAALKSWFANLGEEDKAIAARFPVEFKKDLVRIAKEKDEESPKAGLNVADLKAKPEPIQTDLEEQLAQVADSDAPTVNAAFIDQEETKSEQLYNRISKELSSLINSGGIARYMTNEAENLAYLKANAEQLHDNILVIQKRKLEEANAK